MADFEKIKREVESVCNNMDIAFKNLTNKSQQYDEAQRQVNVLKDEILLLQERKANVAQSVRDEQNAASEGKKQYTDEKLKYRKLRDEGNLAHTEVLAKQQAEIDSMRIKGMSQLQAEQGKIVSEIKVFKQERDGIKKEYFEYKELFRKMKKEIPD